MEYGAPDGKWKTIAYKRGNTSQSIYKVQYYSEKMSESVNFKARKHPTRKSETTLSNCNNPTPWHKNEEIRRRTRVTDVAQRVAKLKWKWAGNIARRTEPRTGKRSVVRPPTRWKDDIKRVAGSRWKQAAQDRGFWNSLQKTYVPQWLK
ncbi:jg6320 [Pararge aegeria aegeria]|uniref:Jg6320 protein n=1 Tax=Pararge aegeria aegeria TaxID=348720 RepID=A0A8S4RAR1_9NEOP|nr:jg6320 [Pararge aegeria aegeria]